MTGKILTDKEKTVIEVASADGQSLNRVGKLVRRSPNTVKAYLAQPGVEQRVEDEKQVLAEKYRRQAHRVLDSISNEDISKASLQQKSISSGVLLDKSLLLSGDPVNITASVGALMVIVDLLRDQRDHRQTTPTSAALPAPVEP